MASSKNLEKLKDSIAGLVESEVETFVKMESGNKKELFKTALAAAAQALGVTLEGGEVNMADKDKEKKDKTTDATSQGEVLAKAIAAAVGPAVKAGIEEGMKGVGAKLDTIAASLDEQKGILIEASTNDIDADEDEEDIAAGGDDDEVDADEDDEMSAAGKDKKDKEKDDDDDEDEEDDMDAELEKLGSSDPDSEPGKLNKDAKNKGRKTSVTASTLLPKGVAAATMRKIKQLSASNTKLGKDLKATKKELNTTKKTVETLEAQVETYAHTVERRSVPPELSMLLQKAGFNTAEMFASGTKLKTDEVDLMFKESGLDIPVVERMKFKNILLAKGLMEQGEVKRDFGI